MPRCKICKQGNSIGNGGLMCNCGKFSFELLCQLPEGMTNEDALGIITQCGIEATIGIGKEGELGMIFTELGTSLKDTVKNTSLKVSQSIPGSTVSYNVQEEG